MLSAEDSEQIAPFFFLAVRFFAPIRLSYLLVGQGLHIVPIASTPKVLTTPPLDSIFIPI
jgi:hypothetical protein